VGVIARDQTDEAFVSTARMLPCCVPLERPSQFVELARLRPPGEESAMDVFGGVRARLSHDDLLAILFLTVRRDF
jgi:hypothetical protein